MCVCVCVYVCIYVYIYTCTYIYIQVCICEHKLLSLPSCRFHTLDVCADRLAPRKGRVAIEGQGGSPRRRALLSL